MVNESPNEIVDWLPAGDAFRILDLDRLESETLPSHFRHSRFQSLVRQLNFYNFRKVNRERTFWVYKHPLFHRDRPQDLPLLRRKTCPGVDGRKSVGGDDLTQDSEHDNNSKRATGGTRSSARNSRPPRNHDAYTPVVIERGGGGGGNNGTNTGNTQAAMIQGGGNSASSASGAKFIMGGGNQMGGTMGNSSGHASPMSWEHEDGKRKSGGSSVGSSYGYSAGPDQKRSRTERSQQSQTVAAVSQQLEAYARRARTASYNSTNGGGSRSASPVVMEMEGRKDKKDKKEGGNGDTMRFHALTYDDEIEDDEEEEIGDRGEEHMSSGASSPAHNSTSPVAIFGQPTLPPAQARTPTPVYNASPSSSAASSITSSTSNAFRTSLPKTPSSAFCPKLTITLPTKESSCHPSIHESSPYYSTLTNPPIADGNLFKCITSKISLLSSTSPQRLTEFCLRTPPADIMDPTKRVGLDELFESDEGLKREFNLYRNALSPRSSFSRNHEPQGGSVVGLVEEIRREIKESESAQTSCLGEDIMREGDYNNNEDTGASDISNAARNAANAASRIFAGGAIGGQAVDLRDFTPFCINHLRDTFKEGYEVRGGFTEVEKEAVDRAIGVWFKAAIVTQ